MPRWTPEARLKQAIIQKTRQSWRHSTGPKTGAGKARSSLNAWKDGYYGRSSKNLRKVLAQHSRFLKALSARITNRGRICRHNNTSLKILFPFSFHPAIKASCFPEQDKNRSEKEKHAKSPYIRQNE